MDIKGEDTLLSTSRITEWNINNGGYLSILFGGFLLFGCIVSYAIAVLRGSLDPFLPLISDAAGSPPQNGIFGTLICLGGIIGVFFMILRYMIVMEQNQARCIVVRTVNRMSLVVGIASLCGITLITGYPINFYRDRDVWMKYVGIPHMIGGVTLFSLGLIYAAMQCVLTLYLRPNRRDILFLRLLLCLAGTAAFVYHLVTVPENFEAMPPREVLHIMNNLTNVSEIVVPTATSLKLPIDMTDNYIASAISQWSLVLLFCLFFFTFFGETQEYSLQITIETHDNNAETSSEVASDLYGYKDGPSSYVRKTSHAYGKTPILVEGLDLSPDITPSEMQRKTRRDSSCQTRSDLIQNPRFSIHKISEETADLKTPSVANGTKTKSDGQIGNGNLPKSGVNTESGVANGELKQDKMMSTEANGEGQELKTVSESDKAPSANGVEKSVGETDNSKKANDAAGTEPQESQEKP